LEAVYAAPQVGTGEGMGARVATALFGLGMLLLPGCAVGPDGPALLTSPAAPPAWALHDRFAYNNQQVALFVSRDPGWQAWLNAFQSAERANNALVQASRYNTPVIEIIQAITAAQGAYRLATSFNLPPFTVTSSCRDLPGETSGYVQAANGLILRYRFFAHRTGDFENGSSCAVSVGFIDEVDSSGGLPIAAVDRGKPIDWNRSFSHYLLWRQPFWQIVTGTTLSLPDLVDLIEK
jgi:hypothetical protein